MARELSTSVVLFAPFCFDLLTGQLWREDQIIPLRPKPLALLRYLIERRGQVVSAADLFQAVWPGTVVSRTALKVRIRELRAALEDHAKTPRFIETIHGQGYRFIAKVVSSQYSVDCREEENQKAKVLNLQSAIRNPPAPSVGGQSAITLVGRETELTQLREWLDKAADGHRQIVFVTGEPGIGKTTLVETFLFGVRSHEKFGVREREETQNPKGKGQKAKITGPRPLTPDPWITRGQCIEHYGPGEGYLPLLEALGRLCRESGGRRLIELLRQHAPTWLGQMPALLSTPELEALQPRILGATQERMLRELAEALEVMTAERPLVLCLEDLQWSDVSTLDFLSALARRQEPCRLLVLGTYRPVDVFVREHPLKAVKQELQMHGHCQELALDFLREGEVSEYLAVRFPVRAQQVAPLRSLAHLIYRRTDGNPLFMVNLVEHLLSQGVLAQVGGHWIMNKAEPTAAVVPESLRQMIEERLAHVQPGARTILEVASVVGAEFSVAAVAAGVGTAMEAVEEQCTELARQEQFLQASGTTTWPDGTVAARYGFRHALYQDVLYGRLSAGRRQRLHQRLGARLEQAYGERAPEIAAELAVHFEQGQEYQRAVHYLGQAAQNALQRSADREAVSLLTKALGLLKTLPDTSERSQQELMLQVTLGVPLLITKGYSAPEVKSAYDRARALCQQVGESPHLFPVLLGLTRFYIVLPDFRSAAELGEELLRHGHSARDPRLLLGVHMMLGANCFFQGEFASAHTHAERGLTLYDPQQHQALMFLHGDNPQVLCSCWAALTLWYLGYPDQALDRIYQALGIAQELAHPFSLTFVLFWTAFVHNRRREVQSAQAQLEVLLPLTQEHEVPHNAALGTGLWGWVLAEQGRREEGITQIQRGLAGLQAMGQGLGRPYFLGLLAEVYSKDGQVKEGMAVLTEALDIVHTGGERMHQAELYRLAGELALRMGERERGRRGEEEKEDAHSPIHPFAHSSPEECFHKAIDIARTQQAKSLELRAAMSLSRLWQSQGKKKEARHMLSEIYGWFTEGFDTKDLQEAKTLLAELME